MDPNSTDVRPLNTKDDASSRSDAVLPEQGSIRPRAGADVAHSPISTSEDNFISPRSVTPEMQQLPVAAPPSEVMTEVNHPQPVVTGLEAASTPNSSVAQMSGETLEAESTELESSGEPSGFEAAGSSEPPVPTVSKDSYFSPFRYNKTAFVITGAVILIVILIGAGSWLLSGKQRNAASGANVNNASQYATGSNLRLNDVGADRQLEVGPAETLTINGELRANDTLVVSPTSQPRNPSLGQIYYDKITNAPYYYNGQQFISLAPQHVTSIGGADGVIGLGPGLVITGNQLSVSSTVIQSAQQGTNIGPYVKSLQGQTGNVVLNAGAGINVSGTTIGNNGVITLAAGSSNLTVSSDGSGHYTVSAASASGISGSGTAGFIPKFTGATSVADSGLSESGSTLTYGGNFVVNATSGFSGNLANFEVNGSSKLSVDQAGNLIQAGTLDVNGTGASDIAGSLSVGTGLTVTSGGINATGNSNISGSLGGLTGLTSSGTITFSNLNSSGVVHTNGSGILSTSAVVLGTDTSGNYVANLGALTGLTATGNTGAGSTPTLSVNYGSTANTAVQGNTALTCASGTGNLSGGGNVVTLGAGGSCGDITITNSPTFSGTLTVQGAGGVTVGVAGSTAGIISLANAFNSNMSILQAAAPSGAGNASYTLPSIAGGTSDEICLVSLGNCAGSGGGITGSGTAGTLAIFTGAGSIGDSTLTQSGSTLTASGNLVIQGAGSLALGTASANTGSVTFNNSTNGNTLTLQAGTTSGNLTFTLPTADGSNGSCLLTDGAGHLNFASCTGGAGGGVTSLNGLVGVLTLNNATGSGTAITINDASTSQKGIAQFSATNFTASGGAINTVQDIASTSSPTFAGLTLTNALTVANGGTGANTFTSKGILYGNGTGAVQATGSAANSVLATDSLGTPGLTQTLPAAVQTNITATGALTGGSIGAGFGTIATGNAITTTSTLQGGTLNVGSSNQFQVDASGNVVTTGTAAVKGAGGVTVGIAGNTTGVVKLANSTNTNLSILQPAAPSGTGDATYVLPGIAGGSSDTVCLVTLGNCAGSGTGIVGSGTAGHLAVFNGSNSITDSNLTESGSTLTYSGNLVVNAAPGFVGNLINLEVSNSSKFSVDEAGNSIQAGTLTVNGTGASSIAGSLSVGVLGTNGTIALCSNAGQISSCASSGSIGFWNRTGTVLQPSNSGDSITTSGNISTSGTGGITSAGNFVANGTALFQNSSDSSAAFRVQNSGGSNLFVADTSNSRVGVNTGSIALNTNLNVYNGGSSTTQTDFTQNLTNAGINLMTNYVQDAYTAGLFWSTQNNNPTSPKAGIYTQLTNNGSKLLFGTSSSYSAGITNNALTLGYKGDAIFRNGTDSAVGFQVQNAVGFGALTVNTSTGAVLTSSLYVDILGSGSTTAVCWNSVSSQISSCASTGSIGFWNRTGTTLQPANAGDNILTSGSGTITAAGILNANATGKTAISIADSGTQSSGITIGGDTNLYRSQAGVLATDGDFSLNGGSLFLNNDYGIYFKDNGGTYRQALTYSLANNLSLVNHGSTGSVQIQNNNDVGNIQFRTGSGQNLVSSLSATGQALFQNSTDSATAFQIQKAGSGGTLFGVDTSGNNVTIGATGTSTNASTVHIADQTNSGTQTVSIGSTNGSSTTLIQGGSPGAGAAISLTAGLGPIQIGTNSTAHEVDINNTTGASKTVVSSGTGGILLNPSGASNTGVTVQPVADSTAAFQVQKAGGASLVNVDSLNSNVTLLGNTSGALEPWQTASNSLPATQYSSTSVVANGYVYEIGGFNGGALSTVYYAKLNSDGSVGTWSTAATALPAARQAATSVVYNGYVYVLGGTSSGGTAQSTVYYAKLNSDGSVGTWQTASNALPATRSNASSVVANGYVYEIGGSNGSFQSTVYYAKLNSDGSVGTWQTAANSLPLTRAGMSSVVANGYVYAMGGTSGSYQSTVYYAKLNSDGSVGTWSTAANALPAARNAATSVVANGYVYEIGGYNSSVVAQSTVYYAKLNSDGSVGTWNTAANALPDTRAGATSVMANGYVYVMGGTNGTNRSTVYYASVPRLQVGGSLDLVGLQGTDGTDGDSQGLGSVGGNLTAGDTNIVGTLQVQGAANFSQSVAINGTLNVGNDVTVTSTSTKAFQVQTAGGSNALSVDTANKITTVTAGTDTATLGSTLFTGSLSGTGWTTSGTGASATATHTSGTTAVAPSPALSLASGTRYYVAWTITNPTVGSTLTLTMGGQTLATYSFDSLTGGSYSFTDSATIISSSTANLQITPSSSFTGTISGITVQLISYNSAPALVVNNASGAPSIEVRSSGDNGNLFVGYSAGTQNVTSLGWGNTALGSWAMQYNVSGIRNTALGTGALESNSSGADNVAVGYNALQANTSGFSNVGIGSGALQSNVWGNDNVAIGNAALSTETAAYDNIAIGHNALQAVTSNYGLVAIGSGAGGSITTGGGNTAVGYAALRDDVTGYNNTALGQFSLEHTTGNENVGLGIQALVFTTTGSQNTSSGAYTLYSNTTGSDNTSYGYAALATNVTGNNNTALGAGADVIYGGLQNTTAIGANTQVGSNDTIILGNNNNVGIGTAYAQNPFEVMPNTYSTGTISQSAGSGAVTGSGTSFSSAMVGATLFYPDGGQGIVTAVADATHLTSSNTTENVSASSYAIVWGGFNVNNDASLYLQPTTDSSHVLDVVDTSGDTVLEVGTSNGSTALTVNQWGSGNLVDITRQTESSFTINNNGEATFHSLTGNDSNNALRVVNNANTNTVLAVSTLQSTVTISGTTSAFGNLILTNSHFKSTQTNKPTIGTPTSCATTPSASVANNSTDSAGSFTITSGSGTQTATCQVVITFNKAYGAAPKSIVLTGASTNASKETPAVTATSATTFTVVLPVTTTASTAYQFYYWVVE